MINKSEITITVNGERFNEVVEPRMLASDFIREQLKLTGTHVGCEHGVCGACTILVAQMCKKQMIDHQTF